MNKFLKFVVARVLAATTLASYAASFVGERSDFRTRLSISPSLRVSTMATLPTTCAAGTNKASKRHIEPY